MSKVHYTLCPVCSSSSIHPLLTVEDHSVSKEKFVIWQCEGCRLRFTQDVPDEGSIGPYYQSSAYISHSNTSKGLVNSLYQNVRKFTLRQKGSLIINNTSANGNILDVGAGVGAFLAEMKRRNWQITGIEPDEGARDRAKKLFGIDLLPKSQLESLPYTSFDAITLWHVLEHVESLHDYVELLKNLLNPGGKIFIAVPNYESLDADVYGNYWAAYDVPRHLYHFTPKSMEVLMQKHGLKVVEKRPMWFDAFYISLLSSKYRNGKTNWLAAGINGLRSNLKTIFKKEAASSLVYIVEAAKN